MSIVPCNIVLKYKMSQFTHFLRQYISEKSCYLGNVGIFATLGTGRAKSIQSLKHSNLVIRRSQGFVILNSNIPFNQFYIHIYIYIYIYKMV